MELVLMIGVVVIVLTTIAWGTGSMNSRSNAERSQVTATPHVGNPTIVVQPTDQPNVVVQPPVPVVVHPQPTFYIRVEPQKALEVIPPARGAWEERGWTRSNLKNGAEQYEGVYSVVDRRTGNRLRFSGRILIQRRDLIPYISSPPDQLRKHKKWPCFAIHKGLEYRIHWRRPAPNVDEAILYVERVLDEAINQR